MWCGIGRAFRDAHRRRKIVVLTLAALALWVVASDFMLDIIFETMWELAHTRPFPSGVFPEGWSIYGDLAAYSLFGAMVVWCL